MQLWEHIRDWLLLLVLLLTALVVMATQNQSLVRAVRAESIEWTARLESRLAWVGRYLRAVEVNDELRRQNIELSSEVARSRAVRTRNRELEGMLRLRDSSDVPLVAARIVTKDITRQRNFLTIDAGRSDSIDVGMPVVHERGIVGKVVLVSDNYARVMPYLNTDFRVPGKIAALGAEGIVRWEGDRLDRLLLQHVVKTESVERGQVVVTSSHSGVFPPGRRIGTVDSVAVRPGRNELRVFLRPSVELYAISHVFVARTRPSPERVDLERREIP